ncbi:cellulose synthase-like protein E6 isoform X3 [Pyrus x bretschneideri]|uniref:cellulose synthase-like protein E6 isoform X3 n=1 Tax=Pyrus x bretschneideri TaxID=225117 RepID=UPI00202F0F03|nr:cellulose synthase-like protein E6 isoform X3 [Pyrus x bretschneideri]
MEKEPLFETKRAKGRVLYRVFAASIFAGICLVWVYRASHIPKAGEDGRFGWIGLLGAEIWFGFYWLLTQASRWNPVYRHTFKDRLSQRYENELPGVDVFVCTADATIEPPLMVINTVLSVMAYDYPPEKLSIYLSDDGGSAITYYALLEAAEFAKQWIPYCKRYKVEPRSPAAYFVSISADAIVDHQAKDFWAIKIRVSSNISNGKLLLNVDCDMYSNNSMAIRDALCFFMDEEKGHEIAYVQFPQNFENLTKNELYASLRVINEVEAHGVDSYGGPLYIGSGCFHRRDTLCGRKFSKGCKSDMKWENRKGEELGIHELEESSKSLASCTVEENTQWGREMGLKYGCPVEDIITGLSIHCRGWKSVNCNPTRKAFLGLAPATLPDVLVQYKRWSEGNLQILLSKYSPAWYAYGKISLGHQLGYLRYSFWAANCWATLVYSVLPALYLLRGTSLFPQISSPWFIPFAYAIIGKYTWSFVEFLWCGGTTLGWWNEQRIWLYQRTSSYLFAFIDTILHSFGYSDSAFVITAKVADEDVSQRYKKEIMEFGDSSLMLTPLATLALLNLYCFAGFVKEAINQKGIAQVYDTLTLQIMLCGALILINLPLYQALYLRKDKGKIPATVTFKSMAFAVVACTCFKFSY